MSPGPRFTFGRWRRLAATVAMAAMAGCASTPAPVPLGDTLAGRLAVRVESQPTRSLSASFELCGTPERGRLTLNGPLGTTAAQATWAPGQATLVTSDGRTDYPDLDTLSTEALGERIPLTALFDWLRGRAWLGAATIQRQDGTPGFVQLGWEISLARFTEGWVEARRIAAPVVVVRARVDTAP
ncbi:MAG: outer membrane lipoprotein LolB [Burkholderiales bacterium]|nr:outer membrane lipoprotein LolB [Burkholderiales bacterium]